MNKGNLFKYLPISLTAAMNSLPERVLDSISELRIRKNAPISITVGSKNLTFDKNGRICDLSSGLRVSGFEFSECLSRLTNSSLYACDEYLKRGFIPLEGGGRVGVCGRGTPEGGFAEIFSLNIRFPRFLPDVAVGLIENYREIGLKGTLVCSPPAMGKTTFLKSAAFLLASGKGISAYRVGIADERMELSSSLFGCGFVDILTTRPKAESIELLTRTMSPEIIICDEISAGEVDAVIEAQSSGVVLIASAHCKAPSELARRGRMKRLIEGEIFPLCVVLGYDDGYTCEIFETEELL